MSEQQEKKGSNWWEGYIIRYSLGCLIGAIICWYLVDLDHQSPAFNFINTKDEIIKYAIVLLMGLAYSFISSSPMLVLHITRPLKDSKNNNQLFIKSCTAIALLIFIVLFFSNYFDHAALSIHQAKLILFFSIPLLLIIYFQTRRLPENDESIEKIFNYYDKLSLLRFYTFTDIMTSYKHIREHGNSYCLVGLEILLGLILLSASKVEFYLIPTVVLIWISPAAYAWKIGTKIEWLYINKYYEVALRKHKHKIDNLKKDVPSE